jgi:hypothetical protein
MKLSVNVALVCAWFFFVVGALSFCTKREQELELWAQKMEKASPKGCFFVNSNAQPIFGDFEGKYYCSKPKPIYETW